MLKHGDDQSRDCQKNISTLLVIEWVCTCDDNHCEEVVKREREKKKGPMVNKMETVTGKANTQKKDDGGEDIAK